MTVSNATILQAATLSGTSDYQQWIDSLSQQTTAQVAENMFDPMNRMYRSMFVDFLINRIGFTWVKKHSFENPLAVFKGPRLAYGNTVQLLAVDYIKTRAYSDEEPTSTQDGNSLFKTYRPKGKAAYVSTNQFRQYPITVNDMELRQGFASDTGLNDFVAQVMRRPFDSDNYAEYRAMINSFAAFRDANSGIVYQSESPFSDLSSVTETQAKDFLAQLKIYADYLRFPNYARAYTPGGMPGSYQASELVLLCKPEVNANLDVKGLAQLFHIEPAQVPYRTIVVDDFGIQGAQAVICSERSIIAMDQAYENGSFYNPARLSTNYFLTHTQVIALDPFEPLILFGYGDGWGTSAIPTITETASGITLTTSAATADPGDVLDVSVNLEGTLVISSGTLDDDVTVAPDSATYEVSAKVSESDETAVVLNSRTYVDPRTNKLHIQSTGLASGNVITVTATGTYTNPTGTTEGLPFASTASVTIN